MLLKRVARTLSIGVGAFLISILPLHAATVAVDMEAERALLTGMEVEDRLNITHVIADEKYEGSVTFTFDLKRSGTYQLEAKTIAPDKSHDSFEVSMNGGSSEVWHVPNSKEWDWNPVETRSAEDGYRSLSAGEHTLTFHGREQTRLDRIRLIAIDAELSDSAEETSEDTESETEQDPKPEPNLIQEPEEVNPATGDTWYVSPTGDDDNNGSKRQPFTTFASALSVADAGDTILVEDGTYHETIKTERSGRSGQPIIIKPAQSGERPILDLKWDDNAVEIKHSYITLRGFEIRNFDEGIRIEGATGVELIDNDIHHGENECVRVRYGSTKNLISGNRIHFCGATDSDSRMSSGNGEAIYLGTAPEQREKYGNRPDPSTHNRIIGNEIFDSTEGVDLKEDSHYTEVRDNVIYGMSDVNSGAINVRGDRNSIIGNTTRNNEGSGIRFGGDSNVENADGDSYHYGRHNVVRDNNSRANKEFGYKLMVDEQDFSCTNVSQDNGSHSNSDRFNNCF